MIGTFLLAMLLAAGCAHRQEQVDPQAAVTQGWTEYRLGEFDRAVLQFDAAVAAAAPGSDVHLRALYGLASTWNLRRPGEDVAKAKALYEQIISLSPTNEMAAWSLLALARLKHLVPVGEDPDYAAVLAAYKQVMEKFPGHLAAKEAFLYYNAALVATLQPKETKEAAASLLAFVTDTNQNAFVGTCYSLLANCYITLNEPAKRLDAEIHALDRMELDPQSPFNDLGWAYWNIATIAEFEVGDFETARRYYKKLIDEYPTDNRKFGAKLALKRMDDLEAKLRAEVAP